MGAAGGPMPERRGGPVGLPVRDVWTMPLDSGGGRALLGGVPNEDFLAAVSVGQLGLEQLGLYNTRGSNSGSVGKKKERSEHGEKMERRGGSHSNSSRNSRSSRSVNVQRWAREHTGLTERRDQREIQTLMMIMAKLGEGEYAQVADVVAQRAKSLLQAKNAKGSWEKSQVIELLASGGGIVPQSEITLTGLGSA